MHVYCIGSSKLIGLLFNVQIEYNYNQIINYSSSLKKKNLFKVHKKKVIGLLERIGINGK